MQLKFYWSRYTNINLSLWIFLSSHSLCEKCIIFSSHILILYMHLYKCILIIVISAIYVFILKKENCSSHLPKDLKETLHQSPLLLS